MKSRDDGVVPDERRRRAGLALMGCAVGDCLGIPFENRRGPPSSWRGDRFDFAEPRWTDDTQQSLVLVDDILRNGSLDPTRVMDRFVAMSREPSAWSHGLHRGTGRGFRHAVSHYGDHGDFQPLPDRAGNGAAMRSAAGVRPRRKRRLESAAQGHGHGHPRPSGGH